MTKTARKTISVVLCALALMLAVAACSSDLRQEALDELAETGVSEEAAVCFVDFLEAEYGLEEIDNMSEEDASALGAATAPDLLSCITEHGGDLSDLSDN